MNTRIRIGRLLTVSVSLPIILFMTFLPLPAGASQLIYTIQTGSFTSLAGAEKGFASAMQKLSDTGLDHIRIEKVGEVYSVRAGKFMEYKTAEKKLPPVKIHFMTALIMKAYIRDERIIRQSGEAPEQQKEGAHVRAGSPASMPPEAPSRPPASDGNYGPEHYGMLPVIDTLSLQGTVVMNNVKMAVIEDKDSKQSGLYKLNDRVGGFIISDISEHTVILNKNNTMVKIELWENKKIALSGPGPDPSRQVTGTKSRSTERAVSPVRGERGIRERLLKRKKQLAERQRQSPVLDENEK